MKKLLTLLTLAFCLTTNAQTWVVIPDVNFVAYLQTLVPGAMQHDSLNTSSTLVTTSTHTINVRAQNISDLTGAQYFTSLTYLDCSVNNITSLPAMPSTLKTLWCSNNLITSLPTLPNALNYLYCDTNSISNITTLPTALRVLTCGFNQLTSLPNFPNSLQAIYCCANGITSLPALPSVMYYLNCTGNTLASLPAIIPSGMTYLYLGNNQLTSLPTSLPNAITNFSCDYNNLTSLPATLPSSLQFFICFNNAITNMPPLPSSLTYFDCSNNQIACFPTFPNSITTFHIDPNPYNCLPNYVTAMNSTDLAKPICASGNTNGCAVAGINQIIDVSNQVNIYPNPMQNNFVIETNNTDKQIVQITDVNGKQVLTQTISGTTSIDISNLSQGIYNLSLISNESVINKRLVIVKQ
ncbi:MAG TPA: leucine-rich repeat domain-containing protein [Bacteroidia bacterium]|nr:leucine-rich repeat domain-containing protein [Bacteroidia bacterium]